MTRVLVADGFASFRCPGCNEIHSVPVTLSLTPQWGLTGTADLPTLRPSIDARAGHYASGNAPGGCWCDYEVRMGEPAPHACVICHWQVTDGQIEFFDDSTHALAGQTVDLPEYP